MDILNPVDYINALLVVKGVRDAYLIQNFESTTDAVDERIKKIQAQFPELKLLKNNNYYFLSLKPLKKEDVDDDTKIARLLRFSCDVDFKDLDRNKETITYSITVHIRGVSNPIPIITYICQTESTKRDAEQLKRDIHIALIKERVGVQHVKLHVEKNIPIRSLIPKLMKPSYKFTKREKDELENTIFNIMNEESAEGLIDAIDFNNSLHRGIMLAFIAQHEYDTLEPFFPLQTSGHMKEIQHIEKERGKLLHQILMKGKKGGKRKTQKKKI